MIGRFRFTEFQLLIVPSLATIVGLLTIYVASTGTLDWDWRDIWISIAFMVAVIAISLWFSVDQIRWRSGHLSDHRRLEWARTADYPAA